jgi:hypothetical protein
MGHLKFSCAEKRKIVAKFLILVADCHSQQMGQPRVAEIEAKAQSIMLYGLRKIFPFPALPGIPSTRRRSLLCGLWHQCLGLPQLG